MTLDRPLEMRARARADLVERKNLALAKPCLDQDSNKLQVGSCSFRYIGGSTHATSYPHPYGLDTRAALRIVLI